MARGVIVKMSYWEPGLIRPEGSPADFRNLVFHWRDVAGPTTFEQFEVGKTVEYAVGRDQHDGTAKAIDIRPATT